ncbi:TMM40 protein, partial [Alectura lathami]|nr:TMM40 protein [Alectura lathami]
MENLNVPFPDLTEEQQDIFQRAFTADDNFLENHEKMNQSFWESVVKCLAATDPPILDAEEKNNLLSRCTVLPGGCAACLKAIGTKGGTAVAVLYLLLKNINPSTYRQLPSSKGKDEKLKVLKRLERNAMLSQEDKKAESSAQESTGEDTQESNSDTEGKKLKLLNFRVTWQYRTSLFSFSAHKIKNTLPHWWAVRWMGIRKDDEFFHFVILCFAIGALLICYYYYKGKARLQKKDRLLNFRKRTKPNLCFVVLDWTISLGIGLITFASLETTGIYFGLVYRLRSILESFIPLLEKLRPTGNSAFP